MYSRFTIFNRLIFSLLFLLVFSACNTVSTGFSLADENNAYIKPELIGTFVSDTLIVEYNDTCNGLSTKGKKQFYEIVVTSENKSLSHVLCTQKLLNADNSAFCEHVAGVYSAFFLKIDSLEVLHVYNIINGQKIYSYVKLNQSATIFEISALVYNENELLGQSIEFNNSTTLMPSEEGKSLRIFTDANSFKSYYSHKLTDNENWQKLSTFKKIK